MQVFSDDRAQLFHGDTREIMAGFDPETVQTCVTSPPYFGLRDYGEEGQIGLEASLDDYVANLVSVFREVHRLLRPDGTLWLNLGDSYNKTPAGKNPGGMQGANMRRNKKFDEAHPRADKRGLEKSLKPKDLMGVPWRVALALQADGWYLRADCIWAKPNVMPTSAPDRPTINHEYLFLLTKSQTYYYDQDSIREPHASAEELAGRIIKNNKGLHGGVRADLGERPRDEYYHEKGRNKRSVWWVSTKSYPGAHFATFPEDLVEPCILAGSSDESPHDIVLDPFVGSGTTVAVAKRLGRTGLGVDLNREYLDLAVDRVSESHFIPRIA